MRRSRSSVTEADSSRTFDSHAGDVFGPKADAYEEVVNRSISFTRRDASFFAERKVALLRRLLHSQGCDLADTTVLDVGCGTGTTDRHLVGEVKTLHGVDLSEEMLIVARRHVREAHFESYDGKALPFPEDSFDVVIAICVLHHVPPTGRTHFIEELRRVTRTGGFIAIFEHNPLNPLTRRAVRGCELDSGVVLLTTDQVARLLTEARTNVIRREYFLFTPFGGRLGSNLDRGLRRVPLGGQHVVMAMV